MKSHFKKVKIQLPLKKSENVHFEKKYKVNFQSKRVRFYFQKSKNSYFFFQEVKYFYFFSRIFSLSWNKIYKKFRVQSYVVELIDQRNNINLSIAIT